LDSPRRLIALLFHARNFFLTFFEGGTRTHTHEDKLLICGKFLPTGRGFETKLPAGFTPLPGPAAATTAFAFIDVERPAVQFVSIHCGDGAFRFAGIGHFDEREPAGAPGVAIRDQAHTLYFSIRLKQRPDGCFGSGKIQITYKNILHLISLTFW
jgi:hypothetical protein